MIKFKGSCIILGWFVLVGGLILFFISANSVVLCMEGSSSSVTNRVELVNERRVALDKRKFSLVVEEVFDTKKDEVLSRVKERAVQTSFSLMNNQDLAAVNSEIKVPIIGNKFVCCNNCCVNCNCDLGGVRCSRFHLFCFRKRGGRSANELEECSIL